LENWFVQKLEGKVESNPIFNSDEDRSYFRQFFHDMRLNESFINDEHRTAILGDEGVTNKKYTWYFQEFKASTVSKSPIVKDEKTARDEFCKGIVRKTTPQFEALQRYLNSAPEKMRAEVFEDSIGYKRETHSEKYLDKQISKGFSDFSKASVVPFTVNTFFALELGEEGAKNIWKKLLEEFGKGEFAELQAAIDDGTLSKEQVEKLREQLTEKMLELLGPVKYLTMDVPILSDVENAVADVLMGEEVEELRKYAAEFELNEEWFENACEAP
jgi:hypothetical protein